jgi:CheY-like chemotaxis protein
MRPKPILVIDDDPAILDMIAELLGFEGYHVITISEGSAAVAQAKVDPPALILLDLMMPEMSGWQIVAALQASGQTRSIPIVLLSARRDLRTTAAELGVTTFLEKPFELNDLLNVVERYAATEHQRGSQDSIG